MANNPYVNKVQYGNQTIIDISGDTVTANDLWVGVTAHDASGAPITGTLNVQLDTLDISPTESTQEFFPEDPYWGFDSVTVGAISSNYVGSNIARLTSSDLEVSIVDFPGAKDVAITLPAGYLNSSINTNGNLSEATFSTATSCTINTNGTISMNFKPSAAGIAYTNSTYSISRANAVTVRSASDLSRIGATISVPSGYYASAVSSSVPLSTLPTQSSSTSSGAQAAEITATSSTQYVNIGEGYISANGYYKINPVEDSTFVITIVYDDNNAMWVPNKTFAEISAAYHSGKTLVAEIETDDPALYEVNGYYEEGIGGDDSYYYSVAEWQEDLDFSLVALYYGSINASGYSVDPPENYYNTSVADASASEVAAGSVFFNDSGYQTGTAVRRDSTSLTASGATVTVPAGYYAAQASKTLASATLPTQVSTVHMGTKIAEITPTSATRYLNISGGGYISSAGYYQINAASASPSLTSLSVTPTTSQQTFTPPSGYDGYDSVVVDAMPTGSATTPTTTISVTPTISVNGAGLITVSGTETQNITPTISAGYITTGTAGAVTASASNTYQLTRLTATAYNVSTDDQLIAVGQYITGQQRIRGVVISDTLTAANIKSGVNITIGDSNDTDRLVNITGTYTGSGDTKIVTGTFTTPTTEGAASTVTIPYTGTGYPIMAVIVINEGIYDTSTAWYSSLHRYAIGQFTLTKSDFGTAPTYTTSGAANYGCTTAIYKNSTSNSTSYTRTSAVNANTYTSSNANSTATTSVRFKSKTSMSIFVSSSSGTSYGLLADTTYRYWIYYSA